MNFGTLASVAADPDALMSEYDALLGRLFSDPPWDGEGRPVGRIPWRLGRAARKADRERFRMPGLYLWGAGERPVYVGITRGSFSKRFNRYIWSSRSQCQLAANHEAELLESGLDGFPQEVREWYARSYRTSTVRLNGAVRFAREGLDSVWFYLLPTEDPDQILPLEKALVPVAQGWNRERGLAPLLNKVLLGR